MLTRVLLRHPWIRAPSRSTKWLPDEHSSSTSDEQLSKTSEGGEETEGRGEGIPKMDPRSITDASLEGNQARETVCFVRSAG